MDNNQSSTQIIYLDQLAEQLSRCGQRIVGMRESLVRSTANHGPTGIVFSPPAFDALNMRSLDQSWLQCGIAIQLLESALDDRGLTMMRKWPDP